MIYDLLVVGNGLAAQTFLFELFNQSEGAAGNETKSQNFSVVQVYADDISPPCSLRTTATVALSGIEEGISPLGNELRESYFYFEDFFKKHSPEGIFELTQFILHESPEEEEKLRRRYATLTPIKSPLLKQEMTGIAMPSYLISPATYKNWLEKKLNSFELSRLKNFVRSVLKNEQGIMEATLQDGTVILAKKILLGTGAYSKIFSSFISSADLSTEMEKTGILSGSYLERTIDLNCDSFYVTLEGQKCVYRSSEKQLVIGSVSQKGPFLNGDLAGLKDLVDLFKRHLTTDIGEIEDFKQVTGLRHKGRQRRPIYRALDPEKKLFMISGFYKNGFTFCHLAARAVLKELNL